MPATSGAESAARPPTDSVVGAIPARYASTRLPGKPLRTIAGKTLIEHVYRRAEAAAELDRVVVLTDDERIGQAVSDFGGRYELTPGDCASGTDRIAFAARRWEAAAVVNIQGDEPLIDPAAINRLAIHLKEQTDGMVTLAAPADERDLQDPNVVKVVTDLGDRALYFSRAQIPFCRSGSVARSWKHIGIYGYKRETLLRLADLPPSPLEQHESLEQLRALENGIEIRVLRIERAWRGVDTMRDLEEVEALLGGASGPPI